jgi:hypothetical protein
MSASRSRQKRKLEPISLEELAGATGMSGFCSFLTRDASIPVPVLDELKPSAPDTAAPEVGALDSDAHKTSAPEVSASNLIGVMTEVAGAALSPLEPVQESAPKTNALETGAPGVTAPAWPAPDPSALDSRYGETTEPELGALETTAIETGALDSRYRRRPRIREAITVEDGHSLAEEAVYEAMWREGKPYRGDSRILTIGLRTLAELSRMAYSNCKANVRSLVAKLALDELPGFSYTDGRTYIIYNRDEILRRRRSAGLTHVLRTRGVAFVNPKTSAPVSSARGPGAPAEGPRGV